MSQQCQLQVAQQIATKVDDFDQRDDCGLSIGLLHAHAACLQLPSTRQLGFSLELPVFRREKRLMCRLGFCWSSPSSSVSLFWSSAHTPLWNRSTSDRFRRLAWDVEDEGKVIGTSHVVSPKYGPRGLNPDCGSCGSCGSCGCGFHGFLLGRATKKPRFKIQMIPRNSLAHDPWAWCSFGIFWVWSVLAPFDSSTIQLLGIELSRTKG